MHLSSRAELLFCLHAKPRDAEGPAEFLGFFVLVVLKTLQHSGFPAICFPLSFLITTTRGKYESESLPIRQFCCVSSVPSLKKKQVKAGGIRGRSPPRSLEGQGSGCSAVGRGDAGALLTALHKSLRILYL